MLKNFYQYSQQEFSEAFEAVAVLANAKAQILQADPQAKETIGCAETIYGQFLVESNPRLLTYHGLMKYLEKDLAVNYSHDLRNPELKQELNRQILLVYLALGNPLAAEIYSPNEIEGIADGRKTDYVDSLLVRTLGKILSGEVYIDDYVYPLLAFLNVQGGKEAREKMDWKGAFIFALILHTLWNHYEKLSVEVQSTLLQNYVYLGVVAGVPVAEILGAYLDKITGAVERQDEEDFVLGGLQLNKEEIPLSVNYDKWLGLKEVITKLMSRLQAKNFDALAQEEFYQELYKDVKGRDIYIHWLREVARVYLFS